MSERLRSAVLYYIAGCCIGILCVIYLTAKPISAIIIGFLISILIILPSICLLRSDEKEKQKLTEQLLQQKKYNKQSSESCWNLEQWKSLAQTVVPDIDEKIEDYEAHEKASEFDETYKPFAKLVVDFYNFDKYYEAISTYNQLSGKAKQLVTINVKQIQDNYKLMLQTQMKVAIKNINYCLSKYKPIAEDLENWQRTIYYYENLPETVQEELEKKESDLIRKLYDGFTFSKDNQIHKKAFK